MYEPLEHRRGPRLHPGLILRNFNFEVDGRVGTVLGQEEDEGLPTNPPRPPYSPEDIDPSPNFVVPLKHRDYYRQAIRKWVNSNKNELYSGMKNELRRAYRFADTSDVTDLSDREVRRWAHQVGLFSAKNRFSRGDQYRLPSFEKNRYLLYFRGADLAFHYIRVHTMFIVVRDYWDELHWTLQTEPYREPHYDENILKLCNDLLDEAESSWKEPWVNLVLHNEVLQKVLTFQKSPAKSPGEYIDVVDWIIAKATKCWKAMVAWKHRYPHNILSRTHAEYIEWRHSDSWGTAVPSFCPLFEMFDNCESWSDSEPESEDESEKESEEGDNVTRGECPQM